MMAQSTISVEQFVTNTLVLLEKERETEIAETRSLTEKLPSKELQRRGVCLLVLHIGSRNTGMFGRTVICFETHMNALPSHKITPGDVVGLNDTHEEKSSDKLGSGIVTKVNQSSVTVAFDDSQDLFSLDDGPQDYYKLTKLANDVTHKRLKRTLIKLGKNQGCLIPVLFGEQPLSPPATTLDLKLVNKALDESQVQAVKFALGQKEVAVIHGPPGTGKTTTVIEIILQTVKQGNKVLACAPSNIAVDNLVERLVSSKLRIVRLGHPARSLPHIQKYSLDAILSTSEETRLVEDVRRDLDKTLSGLKVTKNYGDKHKLREDMKYLRKELRQREETATRDILKRADVVLVTLTSATDDGPLKLLHENHFDVTVIDEVSQAIEAACWIPLLRSTKCILAGDHLQLPPTILSTEAAKEGLEVTLMERILDLYGDTVMKMLTTQYRMNEKIMEWSSQRLYDSKLIAHPSVRHHLLSELPNVASEEASQAPLVYIDTAGCDLRELDLPEEISKGNEGEADLVYIHVEKLVLCGVQQEHIAVIAPYNLQVELIRLRLNDKFPRIEVKSVDGFQGREKEAVIISLVRSNTQGEIGFLSEKRRMNVAVTRARRHLAVIGDSETISKDVFLKSMIDYLTSEGDVYSAHLYMNDCSSGLPEVNRPSHLDGFMSKSKNQQTNQVVRPKSNKQVSLKKDNKQKNCQAMKWDKTEIKKKLNDDAQQESSKQQEFKKQLEDFLANDRLDLLTFPCSLNSHDRLLIHELAEEMKLTHSSRGTGNERYIAVTKPDLEEFLPQDAFNEPQLQEYDQNVTYKENVSARKKNKKNKDVEDKIDTNCGNVDDSVVNEVEEYNDNVAMKHNGGNSIVVKEFDVQTALDGKITCSICKKDVLKANMQLHEIHCARIVRDNKREENVSKMKKQDVMKSNHPGMFDKKLVEKVETVDKDDLDALLETVKKIDNFCCFRKCKTRVQTLYQVCSHCGGRYCMSHHIPEVHGCGDAARKQARAKISKGGILQCRKPDDAKKAQLQRNLNSKLTELSAKRKAKPKK